MAPNQKISREMILDAGYRLVKESGMENLNSRNVAKLLGCSTQPIFSQFPTMEELRQEVHDYACQKFEQDVICNLTSDSFFRSSYFKLINLAKEEKNIFKLIYLSEYCLGSDFLETRMTFKSNQRIWEEFKSKYQLDDSPCTNTLERISLLVHGIATLIATANVIYDDIQIVSIVEDTLDDIVNGFNERSKTI